MEELQALGVRQRLEAPLALDQHLHLEEGQRLEEGPHFRTSLDPLKTQGVEVVDLLGNYTACDIHDICKSGFCYSFFNFEYNVLASTILFCFSFASSASPTFGSLAQGGSTPPTFGSVPQGGVGFGGFGATGGGGGGFGGASPGNLD